MGGPFKWLVPTYLVLGVWRDVSSAEEVALEVGQEAVEVELGLAHDEVGPHRLSCHAHMTESQDSPLDRESGFTFG